MNELFSELENKIILAQNFSNFFFHQNCHKIKLSRLKETKKVGYRVGNRNVGCRKNLKYCLTNLALPKSGRQKADCYSSMSLLADRRMH